VFAILEEAAGADPIPLESFTGEKELAALAAKLTEEK
jgi:hypothetical protein